MFKQVFTRSWSMAHRLSSGRSPKCLAIHGHTWTVKYAIVGPPPQPPENMIAPFEQSKGRINQWIDGYVDHSLALGSSDPLFAGLKTFIPEGRYLDTITDATTEQIAFLFFCKFNALLGMETIGVLATPMSLACIEVEIIETPTNSVLFTYNNRLRELVSSKSADLKGLWPTRNDFTINDC